MARTGISRISLCVLIVLAIASSMSFRVSEARPLRPGGCGGSGGNSPLTRGIEALVGGLYLEAIKSGGGPSPGGKGHSSPTYFPNSGPSPGAGH